MHETASRTLQKKIMGNLDLIDKYFNNSLSPKEQLLFNEFLQNDEEFKSEFLFQKDLKTVITKNQREDLKKTLQNFENEIQKKSKVFGLPKKWLIAASFSLLIGLGFWYVKTNFYPSDEKLFAENFEPYRNIVQPIERSAKEQSIECKAFLAYENGNYYKAINLFNSVKNQKEPYVSFYKALCYLSLEKPTEAINLLLPLATVKNDEGTFKNFHQLSNWYLGLAYLKNNEKKKAISQFSIIANLPDSTTKKKESQELLNYLN